MRYRPTIDRDFLVLVALYRAGRMKTFKYRGSELIGEASGPDFQTAMIHTTAGGLAPDEPWTRKWVLGRILPDRAAAHKKLSYHLAELEGLPS